LRRRPRPAGGLDGTNTKVLLTYKRPLSWGNQGKPHFPPTSAFLKIFPHKNLTFPKKSDILYTQDEERKQNSSLPSVIFKYEKANSTNRWCDRKGAKAATGHR
jgi:hypothetical protein